MKGDVGEQGAHHASLGSARYGVKERWAVEDAGRQPGSDRPPEGGEGIESGQQCGVVDTVEALCDVRIQHILGLATDGVKPCLDGVVGRTSRSEPISVRLELRFPLWFER